MEKLSVDIGFVFALHQEAVGILDRLKHPRKTRGNGRTFHTGTIGNSSVAVVLSGAGQKGAEDASNILIDVFEPKLICSAGYAGGLSKRLKPLTLCVPEYVIRESDNQVLDLLTSIPRKTSPSPDRLTLLTVNDVAGLPKQKHMFHARTGAELIDMETFAVADVCRIRNIPFCTFRIIFDAVEDQIPKDIVDILEGMNKGIPQFSGIILGRIWSRPSLLFDMVSLKKRVFKATERLTEFIIKELRQQKSLEKCLPLERLSQK